MSEIIRDAYCRAILESNPLPTTMETEHYEETLKRIAGTFGKNLEDILEEFSIDPEKNIDDHLIEWTIKSCLPKNLLYQKNLITVTHSNNFSRGSYVEKTYRMYVLSQKDNLRKQDPIWVWENKDLVDKFMAIDNPYYRKIKMVESIFPLDITYFT